ncbi:MAG: hypothetical protein V1820_04715 [archaeon]
MTSGRCGVFFTIDSILALLISSALIFATMSALSKLPSGERRPIQISESLLATFEKNGVFEQAVSNSSELYSEMELAPPALCWELKLLREDGQILASAKKAGCSCTEGSTFARRAAVFRNSSSTVYSTAEGRFCYR